MRKLSRFEKYGIIGALIVACAFFYVKRVYEPQEVRLKRTIAQLNKVVQEINSIKDVPPANAIRRSIQKQKGELEELNSKLQGLLIHTGSAREVTALLNSINKKVEGNGLGVVTLVPEGRTMDGLLEWNLFQVDMEGSFHGFLGFMNDLKKMPDAIKIKNVEMGNGADRHLFIKMKLLI